MHLITTLDAFVSIPEMKHRQSIIVQYWLLTMRMSTL